MKATPILYLDIDGTVRHGYKELGRFVSVPEDVVIFPEVLDIMKTWKNNGGRIIGVSNQGGISLGYLKAEDCVRAMRYTDELCSHLFDGILWCQHHPKANKLYERVCWCRKPSYGLLVKAVFQLEQEHPNEYYPPGIALMVGNREEDQHCARLANIDFMWAENWRRGSN